MAVKHRMAGKIRVGVLGVGNCASSLVQGRYYYKNVEGTDELVPGLMHNVIGGYKIRDIEFSCAFDVDKRKVGRDLSEAIWAQPNNTLTFCKDVPKLGVEVSKGPVLDGVSSHMLQYPEDVTFAVDDSKPVDVAKELERTETDTLICYLPVGSEEAARFYASECLKVGVAFVNCMPVFIGSDAEWAKKFEKAGMPVFGDDVKSQVGATIVHRTLARLFSERGVKIDRTYQLNVGGNTDFMNLVERSRGKTKKISKTSAVQSILPAPLPAKDIHIAPSDYVPWLKDNKLAFIRLEGRKFGDVPIQLELRLSVEDSPNSAGVVIDAIRLAKLALDRGVSGALVSGPAYLMKHPPQQFPDSIARQMVEEFIRGERER
jgi:myo-inositol-1-phosphate synthase